MTTQAQTTNIAELIAKAQVICHDAAASRGWWNDAQGNSLKDNPLMMGIKLLLIHSEITEAVEGDRCNTMDTHLPHRKSVEVELADAMIRILDLAGAYRLDVAGAMAEKMAYNARRADHDPANRAKAGGKKY